MFNESQYLPSIPEAQDIVINAETYGKKVLAIIEEDIAAGAFRSAVDPRLVTLGILGMHNRIHRGYVPSDAIR